MKVILKEDPNLANDVSNLDVTLSPSDIYNTDKINIPLPQGSFSRIDGVFIPIPTYFNRNGDLIHSHWVFKKGQWDGQSWNDQLSNGDTGGAVVDQSDLHARLSPRSTRCRLWLLSL